MITFVCFKWQQPGYRSKFTAEHVNTLCRMVARYYPYPHEFVCVTDDPVGLHKDVWPIELWPDYADLANQSWKTGPSCYRRLRVFSQAFLMQCKGSRIVCLDLDMIICGDLRPLVERAEPLLMWGTGEAHIPVCGSLLGFDAGAGLSFIWDTFNGYADAREACQTMPGSDQAWIAHSVGIDNIACWTKADGVYSFGHDLCRGQKLARHARFWPKELPANARVVVFNGKPDPWEATQLTWVREHYR